MDLVDEQNIVGLEIGQECCQIPRTLQYRPRSVTQVHAHLPRNDMGQCRLA